MSVPFKEKAIFPDRLAIGATGGRGWNTDMVITGGGQVITNQNLPVPLGKWTVSLQNLTVLQMLRVRGLVDVVRGQMFAFRFKAPWDYRAIRVPTRRLTSTTFQMRQRTTGGGENFYLDVKKPKLNDQTLIVTLGNVPTTDYILDSTTGVLTTGQGLPDSVVPVITGDYHIPVMFGAGLPDFEHIDPDYATWAGIELFEVPL